MSEQNNIYVNEFSDEEMVDFASAINSVIETFCKFADKHNFDRDNIIAFVAEKLQQISEIATVKHYKVNEQTTIDPVRHGKWIKPTKRNGISFNIPHCSVCEGVPCGVDENTNYCPNCGAKMDKE